MDVVLRQAFNDQDGSDVIIICENVKFHCHKFILSLVSPVFKAMFSHVDLIENQTKSIEIQDFDLNTVEAFVKLCYGFKIDWPFDSQLAKDFLTMCDKYDVNENLRKCVIDEIANGFLRNWDLATEFAIIGHNLKFQELEKVALENLALKFTPSRNLEPLKVYPDLLTALFLTRGKNASMSLR